MPKNTNTTEDKRVDSRSMSEADIDRQIAQMGKEVMSQQRVPIRLPKNPYETENQPLYVAINGSSFYIPRGVTVNLPLCMVQLLEDQGVI